ncbi:hypothetical protein LX32DRAFT_688100 [Colletotrichum zoysiae]|uniref:Uncharacterized protein n=1 Tax=Colletotrichum zoysiae TaxID=1216348 RepID=A0AAD9H3J8_9PEZI|nr:hypothetical protein LX32DRAFT_688100 [Colletotrichum zoysiae]
MDLDVGGLKAGQNLGRRNRDASALKQERGPRKGKNVEKQVAKQKDRLREAPKQSKCNSYDGDGRGEARDGCTMKTRSRPETMPLSVYKNVQPNVSLSVLGTESGVLRNERKRWTDYDPGKSRWVQAGAPPQKIGDRIIKKFTTTAVGVGDARPRLAVQ